MSHNAARHNNSSVSLVSSAASRIPPLRVIAQDENNTPHHLQHLQQQSKSIHGRQSKVPVLAISGTSTCNMANRRPLVNAFTRLNETSIPIEPSCIKQHRQCQHQQHQHQRLQLTRQEPTKKTRPSVLLPVPTQVLRTRSTPVPLPTQNTASLLGRSSSASSASSVSATVTSTRQSNVFGSAFAPRTARLASSKLDLGSIRKTTHSATSSLKQDIRTAVLVNSAVLAEEPPNDRHIGAKDRRSSQCIPAAPKIHAANRHRSQIPAIARSSVQTIQRPNIPKELSRERHGPLIPAVPLFDTPNSEHNMEGLTRTVDDSHTYMSGMDLDVIPGEDEYDHDPTLVSEYQQSIFAYKREMEIKLMPDPNYMSKQSDLTWRYRVLIIDWLVQAHDQFDLLQETMHLCVNYLDRFLSKVIIPVNQLQLAAIVALLLASKYEEIQAPAIEALVHICGNAYTRTRVREAEIGMLRALNYDMGAPGPMSFLRRISRADNYDVDIRTLAKYLIDVTLCDHRFIGHPPSMIAAVGYRTSMRLLFRGGWTSEHECYSGYTELMLIGGVNVLLTMLEHPDQSHQAMFKRYQDERHMKASDYVQQLGLPLLQSLQYKPNSDTQ